MRLEIRKVIELDLKEIFKFRSTYINMNYEDFVNKAQSNSDLWFVVYDNDKLIGYCLGEKIVDDPTYVKLDEIVTNVNSDHKYKRKGIGTKLINKFEEEVWNQGYKTIGFGSGDKYETEQFYLKNNYIPIEVVAADNGIEFERVKIKDYKSGKLIQKDLHSKYVVKEINFIFEKYFIERN